MMIIACPACGTRYAVPDSAIGDEGRTVRCAKCRHSWYQDGPESAAMPPRDAMAPALATPPPAMPASHAPAEPAWPPPPATPAPPMPPPPAGIAPPAAAVPMPRAAPDEIWPDQTEPAVPRRARRAAASAAAAPGPAVGDDDAPSSYEHGPPFRPRRNPARLWMIAAIAFAVLALGAAAAVVRLGGGDWLPVATASEFGPTPPDLALDFPPNRQDRRTLPDGTQFFGVSGRIINIGRERRSLPNLLILLRDGHDRVVYSWEVVPARRVLAPGESENVIEAVTDIPRAAKVADIGWKA